MWIEHLRWGERTQDDKLVRKAEKQIISILMWLHQTQQFQAYLVAYVEDWICFVYELPFNRLSRTQWTPFSDLSCLARSPCQSGARVWHLGYDVDRTIVCAVSGTQMYTAHSFDNTVSCQVGNERLQDCLTWCDNTRILCRVGKPKRRCLYKHITRGPMEQ